MNSLNYVLFSQLFFTIERIHSQPILLLNLIIINSGINKGIPFYCWYILSRFGYVFLHYSPHILTLPNDQCWWTLKQAVMAKIIKKLKAIPVNTVYKMRINSLFFLKAILIIIGNGTILWLHTLSFCQKNISIIGV
jgi:hypothetical protein